MLDHSLREHPVLIKCRDETLANPNVNPRMQTAPEEAQFLGALLLISRCKRSSAFSSSCLL